MEAVGRDGTADGLDRRDWMFLFSALLLRDSRTENPM